MTSLLRPENVIHIKYIITVLIIESIILDTLARFREDSSRVSRGFVFEAGIADTICGGKMTRERLEGLESNISRYL
jgi:hypothetical protein